MLSKDILNSFNAIKIMHLKRFGFHIENFNKLNLRSQIHQKARKRESIKSIDRKFWCLILIGCEPLKIDVHDVKTLKPEVIQTSGEDKLANANSQAINTIFKGVGPQEFVCISKCNTAKEAHTIHKISYEGTNIIKQSKFQMLTTRFKNLRMQDNETISKFYAKLYVMPQNLIIYYLIMSMNLSLLLWLCVLFSYLRSEV